MQGSGLEGCLQFRGLDWRVGCNSGVWIRGVAATQGSGLEQFRCIHLHTCTGKPLKSNISINLTFSLIQPSCVVQPPYSSMVRVTT